MPSLFPLHHTTSHISEFILFCLIQPCNLSLCLCGLPWAGLMSDSCLRIPKRTQKVLQDEPVHPMPRGVAWLWSAERGWGSSYQRPAATCWQECLLPVAKNRAWARPSSAKIELAGRHKQATSNSIPGRRKQRPLPSKKSLPSFATRGQKRPVLQGLGWHTGLRAVCVRAGRNPGLTGKE